MLEQINHEFSESGAVLLDDTSDDSRRRRRRGGGGDDDDDDDDDDDVDASGRGGEVLTALVRPMDWKTPPIFF